MKRVRIFEHKGESYQLYEFKGVYLHPRAGRKNRKNGIYYKKGIKYLRDENYLMCRWICLKLGLKDKEIDRLLEECEKENVIW